MPKRRKTPHDAGSIDSDAHLKKIRPNATDLTAPRPSAPPSSLQHPHEAILSSLSSKYRILPLSVLSSTAIRKRITSIVNHVSASSKETSLPPVALLYARPPEVCKLITVVEHVRRTLAQQEKYCFQYNELFEQSETEKTKEKKQKHGVLVDETVLDKPNSGELQPESGSDSEEAAFEPPPRTRLEEALLPPAPKKKSMSLRVFISASKITELDNKDGVTLQHAGIC